MVGQEVGIYGVFIWINNEPCITWPSSLDILNTLGHFNFVLLLYLHKTIPLSKICTCFGSFNQYVFLSPFGQGSFACYCIEVHEIFQKFQKHYSGGKCVPDLLVSTCLIYLEKRKLSSVFLKLVHNLRHISWSVRFH